MEASYEPVNFLIMGSDSRDDGNSDNPDDPTEGQRSDTTILVHLYENRDRALAVSIPRDTLVSLPECASESGRWRVEDKFNAAFDWGGPACTVQAVEEMSGVPINHAVVVDFKGFMGMTEALGGVPVCLEEAVVDRDAGLDLPAGWSTVSGPDALAFVRARKALGDGSDISRIERQQQFLASAIREATNAELLLNPVKLYRVLDAATKSLTVDENLNDISEMASMAESVRDLRPENIQFVTLPFHYAGDGSNVVVNDDVAEEIWSAIRADEPWPPTGERADGQPPLTVAPQDIRVQVLNGNGVDNVATDTSNALRAQGFLISGVGGADRVDYPESIILSSPESAEAARTLSEAVPGAVVQYDPTMQPGRLTLIVGANNAGVVPVTVARVPQGTVDDPAPVTGETSICAS